MLPTLLGGDKEDIPDDFRSAFSGQTDPKVVAVQPLFISLDSLLPARYLNSVHGVVRDYGLTCYCLMGLHSRTLQAHMEGKVVPLIAPKWRGSLAYHLCCRHGLHVRHCTQ